MICALGKHRPQLSRHAAVIGMVLGLLVQAAVRAEQPQAPDSAATAGAAAHAQVAGASVPAQSEPGPTFFQRLWDRLAADYAERFQIHQWSTILQQFFHSLLVIIGAGVAIWLIRLKLRSIVARIDRLGGAKQRRKVDTISSLVISTARYAIYIAAALWILRIWGVPTESLIVGTAVIGAAVGFGSQGLVQDIITGLSILAEEQLAIGDYVEISGKAGAVEEIGLRVVKLRDPLGVQHVIFNRTISLVSNYTAGGLQALVDVSLASREDAEAARRVANQVAQDTFVETPYFRGMPEVEGVHQSSTQDVFLRIKLGVFPQQDAAIQAVFVERLKRAFAAHNIIIPDGRVRVIILSELFSKAMKQVSPSALPASSSKLLDGAV